MKNALALLIAFVTVANACASAPRKKMITFREVKSGAFASFDGQGAYVTVASDPETFAKTWSSLIGKGQPPAIDFAKESAIFLFAGPRSTGGFSIDVSSVAATGAAATVEAAITGPSRGSMVTQVLTSPFLVIAVPLAKVSSATWVDKDGRRIAPTQPAAK